VTSEPDPTSPGYFAVAGLWTLIGKLSAALGIVFINIVLANLMSPSDFGAYVLAYSLLTVAASLALLGTPMAAVRLISAAIAQGDGAAAANAFRVTASMGAVGLLFASLFFLSPFGAALWRDLFGAPGLAAVTGFLVLWLASQSVRFYCAGLLRGFKDFLANALVHQIIFFTLLVLGMTVIWILRGELMLVQAVALTAAASVIAAIVGVLAAGRRVRGLSYARGHAWQWSSTLGLSLSLLLIEIAPTVSSQASIWIIAGELDLVQVAIFAVALRLLQVVLLPIQVLEIVLRPIAAQLSTRLRQAEAQTILRSLTSLVAIPALAGAALLLFQSEAIVVLLFGADYGAAVVPFLILVLGSLVAVILGPADVLLSMTGHERLVLRVTVITTAFAVVGAVLLAPSLGIEGVAAAGAAGTATRAAIVWRVCRDRLGIACQVSLSPGLLRRGWALARSLR